MNTFVGIHAVKRKNECWKVREIRICRRGAMQNYILATYFLRQGGLNDGDYIEDFAVNPPGAIKGVFYNQAVAGGAGDVVVKLPIVAKSINVDDITMLAQSERYAHLPWAVNKRYGC